MLRVLHPINLDRWKFPVCTSLRELTTRNPQIDFYSFSKPDSEEDRTLGTSLWAQPHIHKISTVDILKLQFDIVHRASQTDRNMAAAALAKVRSLGRCVQIFTAAIQPYRSDRYYWHYVASVYQTDVLAAVSHTVADDILAKFGRKVDAVIPSGVDVEIFSKAAAQPVDYAALNIRKPYVLFVGFLTARKRPDLFINLASKLPDFDFVMVGGFYNQQEEDYYKQMVLDYPNVKLLGTLPRMQVRDLMGEALALVFPSEVEGLPLTTLEASSMGLPILAQPKTSMPEVIIEDVTGWMFSGEQLQIWVDKLQEISRWTDAQRESFAQQSRSFVTQNYTWDLVAKQYADLYATVAKP